MQLAAIGIAVGAAIFPAIAAESTCSGASWVGGCDVSNAGDRVDIGASISAPGGDPSELAPGDGSVPQDADDEFGGLDCEVDLCRPMDYYVDVIPEVGIEDLASFVPDRPDFTGEPAGVAVVGMPANLYASAARQEIAGELFDYDVVVRFVPAAFRFDYGDGTVVTHPYGGASWAKLGQAEFTPTATSHVYSARGRFTASAAVLYSASVDFGIGGWLPVPGYVEAVSSGYTVRAVEVRTALVDRTCTENPSGPGC